MTEATRATEDAAPVGARRAAFLLAIAVFFTSGLAGLIYQVVWSRMLTLVIGVSIFAITAVICTFMGGLALGSWAVGRWGGRWRDPLLAYGVIEGAIGLYAILTPWIFELAQPLYAAAFRHLGPVGLNVFRVTLSAAILLVPTTLMGGTLPLLSRSVAGLGRGTASGVGILYAINTLGGMAGCLLSGFVLLYAIGVRSSLEVAALLNFAIAALVVSVQRSSLRVEAPPAEPEAPEPPDATARFVLVLFFFTGFAALGYELLWTRALLVYLKASTYAFSLMLGVYLLGVALGSLAAAGLAQRSRRPLLGLALCQLGLVATVLVGVAAFPALDRIGFTLIGSRNVDSFATALGLMFAQAGVVLLPPTLFMGAMFPFGIAAYHRQARGVGRSVGSLYAVNTAGNIAGSLAVGFALIALIGVRHSLVLMMTINLAVAAAALAWLSAGAGRRLLWAGAALAGALAIHSSVSTTLFFDSLTRWPGSEIIFYREGASDTVAVVERARENRRTLIYSDGRGAAGTSTLPTNLYFGHMPMLFHPNPRNALHICYGSGNSVMALTRHDPERVDVIELSPHVKEASPYFWTNEGVIEDPRVNLIIEDGRNYVLASDRQYDVISLEPPNIFTAGVVNLYTQDFYEDAIRRLRPGGIMLQWLPTVQLSKADRAHLIRAFTEAFPHVTVWAQLVGPTILLLGTLEPLQVDVDQLAERLANPALAKDVRNMNLAGHTPREKAESFLSFFLLGDASTRAMVAEYEPVRDDRTIVDYSIPRFVGSGYGFSLYTYGITSEDGEGPKDVAKDRVREYARWADPARLIVPDPADAARVDAAIAERQRKMRALAGPARPR